MIRNLRIRKALIGALVSVALILGAIPTFTDSVRATDYNLWVKGSQVTDSNLSGSGWSYDEDTNTLTLNGFSYENTSESVNGINYSGTDCLNIVIKGNNSIRVTGCGIMAGDWGNSSCVKISGSGSLSIQDATYGIQVYGSLSITGGTLDIHTNGFGIDCQSVSTDNTAGECKISGGDITINAAWDGINAASIVEWSGSGMVVTLPGSIDISGGNVSAYVRGDGGGLQAIGGNVTISGGTVDLEGIIGIYTEDGTVSIDGGNVTAVGRGFESMPPTAISGSVTNAITGTGWTDTEGTKGEKAIDISSSARELDFAKVQFGETAATPATVSKVPVAKTGLTGNGSAQALITAGTASGGTMQYALGTSATKSPTSGWSTKIPTGTDAGTYYVWYKAVGDKDHTDSDPACIKVTIGSASPSGGGGNSGGGGSSSGGTPTPAGSSGAGSSSGVTPTPAGSSGSGSSSGSEDKKPGVADFIERLYTVALGRASDPAGKADWINRVKMQGYTGADLAEGFLYSPEFLDKGLSDSDFLDVLYATFFDRPADEGGKTNWLNAMAAGMSKKQVIRGFIDSTEWANLCLTYGILSGGTGTPDITIEPSLDIRAFVTRLYSTCLGREGDAWGMNDWSTQLANMQISGSSCAWGFFFSDEFKNLNLDDAEYITRLYRTFMNREPDPAGFTDWATRLQNGATRQDVFDGFTGSQEWAGICADYGILK